MAIITISRNSFCKGREIAEKLGKKLGYECIDKKILFESSEQFHVPEEELSRALREEPSLFNRFTCGRQKYLSYIKYSLLSHLQKDNVIYHGIAGQYFLKNVPHALKVRIVSNLKDRVAEVIKVKGISELKARQLLKKDDEKSRKWSLHQFGMDTEDLKNYDLVVHLDEVTVEGAVDIIADASMRPCFQRTSKSKEIYNNLLNSARIQSFLIKKFPAVGVTAAKGKVHINHKCVFGQEEYMKNQIAECLHDIPEYRNIDVDISTVLDM